MKLPGRSVYSTALAIFLGVALLLLGAVALLTQRLIFGQFTELETLEMTATMQRFRLMMDRDVLRPLNMTVGDWSLASGLYSYAEGKDSSLPVEDFEPQGLENLNIDFAAIYDRDGELLYLACKDAKIRNLLQNGELLDAQWRQMGVDLLEKDRSSRSGFFLLQERLAAVSIWQILKNDRSDPMAGTIVGGRILDASAWSFFENFLSAKVAFRTFKNEHLSEVAGREIIDLLNHQKIVVRSTGPDEIAGYSLVTGLEGTPLGVISVTQTRPLRTAGLHASRIFLLAVAAAGGVLVILMWVVLDATILARIHELIRKLDEEKRSGRLPVRLNFKGGDELGTLASSIEDLALRLQSSQSQYRAVVEDQTEMICRFDADMNLVFANKIFLKTFGIEGRRLADCRLNEFLPSRTWENLAMQFYQLTAGEPLVTFTQDMVLPGGQILWFRNVLRRSFSQDDQSVGGQWVLADVTRQIEAQRQMIESERRFRRLFETASDGILLVNTQTMEVADMNLSLGRMLAMNRPDVLGRRLDELPMFLPCLSLITSYRPAGAGDARRSPSRNSCQMARTDGSTLYVELRCSSYSVEQGEYLQINFRDISERVRGEQQLRQLSARLLRMQDEERRRIARELHDSTAQNLSALEMNLSLLDPLVSKSHPRASELVSNTRQIAAECSRELRNISYLLHPPLIDEVGLVFAIKWFADGFTTRTGIAATVEVSEEFPRLPADVEIPLFRVVQEAMTNIYRHSGAKAAWISLAELEGKVELKIRDNGHGFGTPTGAGDGNNLKPDRVEGVGLPGMRERLANLGGNLEIESSPDGVTIIIRLHLNNLSHERRND